MKEFNTWFEISFEWRGKFIKKIIHLAEIQGDEEKHEWKYIFYENVKGENITFVIEGAIDDEGYIRTSGECYIDGEEIAPWFLIKVMTDEEGVIDEISDIDIIDAD